MNKSERYEQYLICKDRGHSASDVLLTSSPPLNICRFCGTSYRYAIQETLEMNAPTEPKEQT
jgi:hypothetical protein